MLFGTRSAMERQALQLARPAQQYVIERHRHQFGLRGNRVSGLEAPCGSATLDRNEGGGPHGFTAGEHALEAKAGRSLSHVHGRRHNHGPGLAVLAEEMHVGQG
jgi:hypothetical protein